MVMPTGNRYAVYDVANAFSKRKVLMLGGKKTKTTKSKTTNIKIV
jgi:hypothetical protein